MNDGCADCGAAFSIGEDMKEKIKAFARTLHIEYLGITSAEPMRELEAVLKKRRTAHGATPFEEQDMEKRINPACVLPEAKSIIVCLFPYANGNSGAENVSCYACIPDYHVVVMQYLNRICDFIRSFAPSCRLLPFVDNGPLVDKYLAYRSGLGFYGKNTLLINETYGSFCFIGYIVTDLSLAADTPVGQSCDGCGRCIRSCPGNALRDEFDFCAKRCVSYITQSKQISAEQENILRCQSSVYGCDICQNVCPHNQKNPQTPIPEFSVPTLETLQKDELSGMSNREFKRKYGEYPFAWRGKQTILKNFGK